VPLEARRLLPHEVIHESCDRDQVGFFVPAPEGARGVQRDIPHASPGGPSEKKTCEFLGRVHDLPLGVQSLYDAEAFRRRDLFECEHSSLPVADPLGEEREARLGAIADEEVDRGADLV
jgi:hypothetical protein